MIEVTRLDGAKIFINELNIQWIESLPDTAVTFLGGARIILRDSAAEISRRCNLLRYSDHHPQAPTISESERDAVTSKT